MSFKGIVETVRKHPGKFLAGAAASVPASVGGWALWDRLAGTPQNQSSPAVAAAADTLRQVWPAALAAGIASGGAAGIMSSRVSNVGETRRDRFRRIMRNAALGATAGGVATAAIPAGYSVLTNETYPERAWGPHSVLDGASGLAAKAAVGSVGALGGMALVAGKPLGIGLGLMGRNRAVREAAIKQLSEIARTQTVKGDVAAVLGRLSTGKDVALKNEAINILQRNRVWGSLAENSRLSKDHIDTLLQSATAAPLGAKYAAPGTATSPELIKVLRQANIAEPVIPRIDSAERLAVLLRQSGQAGGGIINRLTGMLAPLNPQAPMVPLAGGTAMSVNIPANVVRGAGGEIASTWSPLAQIGAYAAGAGAGHTLWNRVNPF